MDRLTDELTNVLGGQGIEIGDDVSPKFCEDFYASWHARPSLVIKPKNTQEVSDCLKLCHEAGQPIVPQGGRTGLVTGAKPIEGGIVLDLGRMNGMIDLDDASATLTVEAGATLQSIQEFADDHNWLFPLDFAARGSCTIGGNLSTNAGGNRVLRYGMARDLCLGLEVVLADGSVLTNFNKAIKNNTGYDLRQLFIGAEGTLGIITKAVLKLTPKPRYQVIALCALQSFDHVLRFLRLGQSRLGGSLTAFEVLWGFAYDQIVERVDHVTAPIPTGRAFYVLVETMSGDEANSEALFMGYLEEALDDSIISDSAVAQSLTDYRKFWEIREGVTDTLLTLRPCIHYDISMARGDMEAYEKEVSACLDENFPEHVSLFFGHIGDGNMHLSLTVGPDTMAQKELLDEIVYQPISRIGGSVSSEHGIGEERIKHLAKSRSESELATMRLIKQALDPKCILNPGKVLATP